MGQYQQADCSRRIQNKYHYILQLKYINMYIYCMGFNFVVLCFMDLIFADFVVLNLQLLASVPYVH